MQKTLELILPLCLLALQAVPAAAADADKTRAKKADETYQRLFRAERQEDPSDPELMEILQKFIFGEVFYIGDLDDKTRELITVTSLAAMVQAMPYIGMPPALTAINLIKSTDAENYRPIYEN